MPEMQVMQIDSAMPISIASHSALMEPAAQKLNELFDDIVLNQPRMPIVANSTGQPLNSAEEIREELRYHVVRGVDWTASVRTMIDSGITTFVEIGPGNVLAGLNKRIDKADLAGLKVRIAEED